MDGPLLNKWPRQSLPIKRQAIIVGRKVGCVADTSHRLIGNSAGEMCASGRIVHSLKAMLVPRRHNVSLYRLPAKPPWAQ